MRLLSPWGVAINVLVAGDRGDEEDCWVDVDEPIWVPQQLCPDCADARAEGAVGGSGEGVLVAGVALALARGAFERFRAECAVLLQTAGQELLTH